MDEQLKNIKFSTKSILLTKRQKETIENLIEQLEDNDCFEYSSIPYWNLSKKDASDLINELVNKVDDVMLEGYESPYDDWLWKDDD